MRVIAATPDDFPWIVARTQCAVTQGFRAIKAVDEKGRIQGMVAFDLWTRNACQCHMATDNPMAWRYLIRPAFSYPFEEVGLGLLLAVIPCDNAKSLALARHFGFTETHRILDGWAVGVDLSCLEMRKADCRWLEAGMRKVA